MKAKLVVVGAGGRMGGRIVALAMESGHFDIVGSVDTAEHPDQGKDVGILAGVDPLDVKLCADFPERADVVIDFSLPQATPKTIEFCRTRNVSLVLGTTGIDEPLMTELQDLAKKTPLVYATNMSVGMNMLFAQVGEIAHMLGPNYDIEIVEQHHRFKKDAPSGTALSLAESISHATGRDYPHDLTHGRHGKETLRQKGTIGMHAVRAGDITGIHEIIYSTLGETVTITHTAHTRDTFVRGALRAAQWLQAKDPGLYSMQDVLGIKRNSI
jgi:4-hydroxy-tetrahydrodipicolinate reductase